MIEAQSFPHIFTPVDITKDNFIFHQGNLVLLDIEEGSFCPMSTVIVEEDV